MPAFFVSPAITLGHRTLVLLLPKNLESGH